VVQDEDGLHDRGGAAWATAQVSQDFPGLEGVGAFAGCPDPGVAAADPVLIGAGFEAGG
jgi:hypothetical protein